MKRIIICFIAMVLPCFAFSGCSNGSVTGEQSQTEQLQENEDSDTDADRLLDRIYRKSGDDKTLPFDFLQFHDDNTFKGLEVIPLEENEIYYGTFSVEKNAITINI